MDDIDATLGQIGTVIDAFGVAVMTFGIIVATVWGSFRVFRAGSSFELYRRYREIVGRSLMLGLEFLVAGDIIRTVAIHPTHREKPLAKA